jgi:hypothetical protein
LAVRMTLLHFSVSSAISFSMKLPRRRCLHLAAGAAALPAVSRKAYADDYPSRPVRLLVGFAPARIGPSLHLPRHRRAFIWMLGWAAAA